MIIVQFLRDQPVMQHNGNNVSCSVSPRKCVAVHVGFYYVLCVEFQLPDLPEPIEPGSTSTSLALISASFLIACSLYLPGLMGSNSQTNHSVQPVCLMIWYRIIYYSIVIHRSNLEWHYRTTRVYQMPLDYYLKIYLWPFHVYFFELDYFWNYFTTGWWYNKNSG